MAGWGNELLLFKNDTLRRVEGGVVARGVSWYGRTLELDAQCSIGIYLPKLEARCLVI